MKTTPVQSSRAARWRRSLRWGSGLALLALMPKCLLCVAAWLGLGAALGLTGPELCGGPPRSTPAWLYPAMALAAVASFALARQLCRRRLE